MASTAPGMLKTFENRMPAPLARRFGSPAAAAWTGIFVLIAVFGIINYSVGMLLDAMLHPAAEEAATVEPVGEPASVVVDLPPPLTPAKAMPVAAPVSAMPASTAQRSTRWGDQSGSRRYRHGWGHRRWRDTPRQPAEAVAAPVATTIHSPSPTGLLAGGLPKRISAGGVVPAHKETAIAAPAAPKPAVAGPPAETATKP